MLNVAVMSVATKKLYYFVAAFAAIAASNFLKPKFDINVNVYSDIDGSFQNITTDEMNIEHATEV